MKLRSKQGLRRNHWMELKFSQGYSLRQLRQIRYKEKRTKTTILNVLLNIPDSKKICSEKDTNHDINHDINRRNNFLPCSLRK